MALKEVLDLDAETTVSIGGKNKKTGKPNPTSLTGYYLGKRRVESRKAKSGFTYLYIFQTEKGNVGVWGKTDLDRKMDSVNRGEMTVITFDRMVPTPNGEMYKFKVASDDMDVIEVGAVSDSYGAAEETTEDTETTEETTDDSADEDAAQVAALAAAERSAALAKVKAQIAAKKKTV